MEPKPEKGPARLSPIGSHRPSCNLLSRTGADVEWRLHDRPAPYPEAVAEMEGRVAAIVAGEAPELVWLVEHPALYTAGTSAHREDLLEPDRLPVFRTGRGGQYTYHGPGQRVAYVMLNLADRDRDVRCFVSHLEDWIIATLVAFGVVAERREDRVGVWMPPSVGRPEAKIAAIGVRVRHWVTFHGISINVAPELDDYAGIVPCGAAGFGVTSLAELGVEASMDEVDAELMRAFVAVFGGPLRNSAEARELSPA